MPMKLVVNLFNHLIFSQMSIDRLALLKPLSQLASLFVGSQCWRQRTLTVQGLAQQRETFSVRAYGRPTFQQSRYLAQLYS